MALSGVAAGVVLTVLSAVEVVDASLQFTVILGILSILLLTIVSDRLLVLVEIHLKLDQIHATTRVPRKLLRWSQVTPFDEFASDADDLLIVGLTKVGVLTEGTERIARLARRQCRVRIAVMDPESRGLYELTSRVTTHTPERLMGDYRQFIETLKTVRANLNSEENSRLQVHTCPWVPTAGTVIAYRGKSVSAQVYFYPYKTDPIDRPAVELRPGADDDWLKFFVHQFELLWQDASKMTPDPTI